MPNRAAVEIPVWLTPSELDLCIQALGQMPYFQVAPLISKIVRVVQETSRADQAEARASSEAQLANLPPVADHA